MQWLSLHPWIEFTLVSVGLALDAILGAWISTRVRAQMFPIWATFLSGNISIMIWAYLTKFSKMRLVTASIFFDIIYNATWMLSLILMGTKLTGFQTLGAFLVVIGVVLFGIGE